MKKPRRRRSDTAFRVAFTTLLGATILALSWQCAMRPASPRLDWRGESAAKSQTATP
jgi:hypothetical protein